MKTQSSFFKSISALIIFSLLNLSIMPATQAALISTETFLAEQNQTTSRDRLLVLLENESVVKKLQEYGVSPIEARARIASLTDEEVTLLNQKIDQLPAGADAAGAILGTALVVFLILLLTDILCWTKVFKFTKCADGV